MSDEHDDQEGQEEEPAKVEESMSNEKAVNEGGPSQEIIDNVRQLLPAHLRGPNPRLKRVGLGKLAKRLTAEQEKIMDELYEEHQRKLAEDPLVKILQGKPDSGSILESLRLEVAKEAASIRLEREEAERQGKETAQTSSRRITALTQIAHIELEIKKLAPDSVDVRSEKFQKIFKMFIETMRASAEATLPPEMIDLYFNHFSSAMEDWEERAAALIR
jgi:hypothetical protein